MAFLELRGVGKSFGELRVLRDIDLAIERGELVAIVGASGSGKTTLISILAGLIAADSGEARLDGRPITGPGPDRAVVFQSYSLLPWLSVFDNIALAVDQVFAAWPRARRRAHVEEHIALVNLTAARDKKPGALSGGMRQRVALARALAMEPEVLLLDEPLGALDALTRATLQTEIERIWAATRKTVVLITNDVDEAILLADRILPLGISGSGSGLAPAIAVDIARPRDRRAVNHDPAFRRIRRDVFALLRQGRTGRGPAPAATSGVAGDAPFAESRL
jgi:nitrate/nitrite transport system ATP-binding protein